MKISTIPLFTLLLTSAFTTQAKEFVNCVLCTTSSSYAATAEAKALVKGSSINDVIIYNAAKNTIKSFDVEVEPESGGYAVATAIEKKLDANTQQRFNGLADAYQEVDDEIDANTVVPSQIAGSAYDLVGAEFLQNDVADYYHKNQNLKTKLATYIVADTALTGKFNAANLVIKVKFSDQSTATYKLVGIDDDGNFDMEILSSKDVDNNPVKFTKSGYENPGVKRFTQGGDKAIQDYISAAARMGINVSYGSSGSGSFKQTMTCDSKGHCTITVKPR